MTIICIDDEKLVLDLTVSLCRELPVNPEVKGFQRAADVLSWLRDNTADIALTDINMPDMNGLVLAAKLKKQCPDMKIIFLTGYSEYAVDAFKLHASGYIITSSFPPFQHPNHSHNTPTSKSDTQLSAKIC